jgi:flagellar protein FlaI
MIAKKVIKAKTSSHKIPIEKKEKPQLKPSKKSAKKFLFFNPPRKILLKKGTIKGIPEVEARDKVTIIPPIGEQYQEVLLQPVKEPYSYVRVIFNNKTNEYLYEVIEPQLSPEEHKSLENIKNTLIKVLEYDTKQIDQKNREDYLVKSVDTILYNSSIILDETSKKKILYYVIRDFIGYGPLDVLMTDPMIEDISCDGPKIPLFVFHRRHESIKTNIIFNTEEELDSYVITLAQRCGKHISVADPMLDATIPDGSRLQATLSKEVTTRGSSFTIRRFRENPLTPADLVSYNTLSTDMVAFLWLAVQHGESMLVSGGTASGKTTTLNAILLFVPPSMKLVSIEDTREINLPHENWIAGLTRSGFGGKATEGKAAGEIDMFELLKAALRQRPEYLIVGEVRGKETYTLFQAMATGHTTYSTIHADSVDAIVRRLENPPISLPRILLSALNIVILQGQVRVGTRMVRRVKKIVEVVGIEPETNELITNTVYEWTPVGDAFVYSGNNYLFGKIMARKNMTSEEMAEEFKKRREIVEWMAKKKLKSHLDVASIVSSYYKDPEKTIEKVRAELYGTGDKEKGQNAG